MAVVVAVIVAVAGPLNNFSLTEVMDAFQDENKGKVRKKKIL